MLMNTICKILATGLLVGLAPHAEAAFVHVEDFESYSDGTTTG